MANINFGEFDLSDPTQESTVQYEGVPPSQVQSDAAASDAGGGSYTTSTTSFRESENVSMDLLANDQGPPMPNEQGPPAPTTTSSNFRASENASMEAYNNLSKETNNSGSNSTDSSSGSSPGNEVPQKDSGYTQGFGNFLNGVGSAVGSGFGRSIVAGMQNAINNSAGGAMGETSGYNAAKYASARKNPLNAYASFNNLFTLACITPAQQNKGGPFTPGNLNNVVCRTQGDWYPGTKHVKTEFGQYDYIIDDLIVASLPSMNKATGAAFATKITFKVTEPYSLGLFFLALQEGAKASGYSNFREAPYLLVIEFAGYYDDKKPHIDPNLTRYIPMRFLSIKLKAGQGGSLYECEGIPYNENAFLDPFAHSTEDVKLSGSVVKDVLAGGGESLKAALQKQAQNLKKDGQIASGTDIIDIQFPPSWKVVSSSGNPIGSSSLFNDFNEAGQIKFPNNDAHWNKLKQIYNDNSINLSKDRNFHFKKGCKIQDMISEIVLRSEYITKQLLNTSILLDPKGMIKWFRVETRVEDMAFSSVLNRQTRKYIYRVVPYEVHVSRFLPAASIPPGYPELNKTAARVYEYLYTGQNTDIINLNLEFNFAFFTAVPSDAGQTTGQENSAQTAGIQKDEKEKILGGGDSRDRLPGDAVGSVAPVGTADVNKGGSGNDTDKSMQAKTLEALLTNEGDLVTLDIEVRGDPYYLPSSGMGNIIKEEVSYNILGDGSMNYQSGETDFVIIIRTPIDLDPKTGLYKFAKTVDELSGLFMIQEVESKFNHNKFTQTIKGIRRRVQLGSGSASKNILFG